MTSGREEQIKSPRSARTSLEALLSSGDEVSFLRTAKTLLGSSGDIRASLAPWVQGKSKSFTISSDDLEAAGLRVVHVGILRNVMVETWLPHLFAALLVRGIVGRFWLGDLETVEQYAASPPSLADRLDVVWVHLDYDGLLGDSVFDPDPELLDTVRDRLVRIGPMLAEAMGSHVLVSNMAPARPLPFNPLGTQSPSGGPNAARSLNLSLADALTDFPRAFVFDLAHLVTEAGRVNTFDARHAAITRAPYSPAFVADMLAPGLARHVAALTLSPKKCVVVDCDNTLWGGVLGEDGVSGIALGSDPPGSHYRQFQQFLRGLRARGTILAVCSKNNESDVLEFMDSDERMVLSRDDFAAHRINWRDKASNLLGLAEELNIGLDSFIFIDDSDVECALVRSALPEVQVEQFPESPWVIGEFIDQLVGLERVGLTASDRTRAATYKARAQAEELRHQSVDLNGFIRELGIQLQVRLNDPSDTERLSQMCLKTNQFNLSTKRYSAADITAHMESSEVHSLTMQDRFTDYGTIGLAIVIRNEGQAELDTLLLSCRAFGRRVEEAFLIHLLDGLAKDGIKNVAAPFFPTKKNAMVPSFLEQLGFVESDEHHLPGSRLYTLTLPDFPPSDPTLHTLEVQANE